jgi:hypothetical protein
MYMKRIHTASLSNCVRFACLTAVLFLAAGPCMAQVAGGTIYGSVKDSSNAAIQKATVKVVNTETQVSRDIEVNDQGIYTIPNLVAGAYEITVAAAGFGTVVRSGIAVSVGDQELVDFQLTPGAVETKIDVTADPPEVELTTSSLDTTMNSTTVRELPLNGRDWTMLAALEPGVTTVNQAPLAISNQRANRGLGTQLSIGGNRPQANNYRLDGISVNDYSNAGPGSVLGVVLGVEAVQEFSVITSSAPASYGRTAGGVINSITRSGTNELHGSAYEFIRNSALDARNFFDPNTVPSFKRNQFGADAGGPIIKDETFVFGDYEGIRQGLGVTTVNVVPSVAARNGNLASGNTITVDPSVKPYLALYPLPNGPVNGDTGIYNLLTQQITNENFFTTRVDHTLTPKDSLFGTYFLDDGKTTGPDGFNAKIVGTQSRRQAVILEETHTFTASLANTVRLGFSRVVSEAPKPIKALDPSASDPSLGFLPRLSPGVITTAGLTLYPGGLSAVGEYDFHYNSYQLYDDAFLTLGKHGLKFGLAVENIRDNELGKASPAGQFIFGNLTAFLQNQPTSFNAPIGNGIRPRAIRQTIAGGYILDDWRFRPNLTINLGLRYEASTVPSEAQGMLSNLPSLTSATPHLGDPFFSNPTKKDFEPRVGFAWDPFRKGRTSVRGGFGIFDNLPLPYLFELTTILSAPYFELGNIASPALPTGSFPSGAYKLLTAPTLRYAYIQPNPPRSYAMQWNFNVQQEIAPNTALMLGYTGSRGVHLPYFINDFDMVLPSSTPQGYVWPASGTRLNPNVGQIAGTLWNSDSIFHALEVQLVRSFSKGLQAGLSYSYGKAIDSGTASAFSDNFANSAPRLWFDPKQGRGPADFDVRHNLNVNFVWDVPGLKSSPSALKWAVNGWQWGGILHVSTGEPFTPQIGGDPLGMASAGSFDRPDVVVSSSCSGSLVNSGNPQHYIKTECFAFPSTSKRLGNAGRNILTGPGITNLDTSLFKNIASRERLHAQFRAEFFNVLNHTNFASPLSNTNLFSAKGAPISSAGVITATTTTSRQIQFGLKLIW